MKRIGIVDIDTSHAGAWIPVLRDLGYAIAGVFDHGDVHPRTVSERFARERGIRLFARLEELVESCDAGLVLSCNWDRHLDRAEAFVRAGIPVFLDKPLAGNPADLARLIAWERAGARVTGGSCMLYAREIREYLENTSPDDGTRAHTLLGGCGVDDFNYGIHAFSSAFAVFGFDWIKARAANEGRLHVAHIVWANGHQAVLTFGEHPWIQSHLTLVGEKSLQHVRIAVADIYRPMLEAVMPYLAEGSRAPVSISDLIQPELAALASRFSLSTGGGWITRAEASSLHCHADGTAFATAYRRQRYPAGAEA